MIMARQIADPQQLPMVALAAFCLALLGGCLVSVSAQTVLPGSVSKAKPQLNLIAKSRRPEIVRRKNWNASAPVGKATKHTPRFITIHHTGMPQKPELSLEQKMRGLQKFSQNEGKLAS